MSDRIPQVLCTACKARNDATFNFCQHCGTAPSRAPPEPRAREAAGITIDEALLAERMAAVATSIMGTAGQKRKRVVADKFDEFMMTRSNGIRGWESATDVDVLEWLCWLDSQGDGTKTVHAADCSAIGSGSMEQCQPGSACAKRYAAQSLDKGFVSKLKCAMSEILGKSEPWNDKEKRGNPADSDRVRRYLTCARVEQRRAGVTVQQARPMLAPVLLSLVRHMRSSAGKLQTAKERVERIRDIALFVVAFCTVQRGLDLSYALAAQVLSLPGGAGLIFNFHFGKTLRDSSLAVVVRQDRECRELCPVRAVQEFGMVAKSMGWALRQGYMFPVVAPDGTRSGSPWAPADMKTALQTHMCAAGLDDGRIRCIHSA